MKKLVCIILCLFLLTGCVSSEKKEIVRDTLKNYFNALIAREYDKANLMVISGDENISHEIEGTSVNDVIFSDISYEIWDITEEEEYLCAEIVVTQISLHSAYTEMVKEYAAYVETVKSQNKVFTDEALEDKWNDIFYKYVSKVTDKVSLKCNVYILAEENKNPVIVMTKEFRNCLFGGELDAINALQKG